MRDRAPVALQMLRGAPSQRLRGQGRIVGAAGAHDGGAEDAEVRHLVREAEAVDHIGLAVVAHARAAIGMGRGAHGAGRPALHRLRARGHEPLRHLVLYEGADLLLVVLVVGGDADHREAKRVFHDGVEVEHVVLVRQRGLLQIGDVPAVGVLLNERLPARDPSRRLAERAHDRGRDRAAVGIDPEIAAADEVEAGMVEVVVGPAVPLCRFPA